MCVCACNYKTGLDWKCVRVKKIWIGPRCWLDVDTGAEKIEICQQLCDLPHMDMLPANPDA